MTQAQSPSPAPKDLPSSVYAKAFKLKELETQLGHLPPENWSVQRVDDLHKRLEEEDLHQKSVLQMEHQTELLFMEICEELRAAGFSNEHIAAAINALLCLPGNLPYCNAHEVGAVLD
jgi:hypothetical protein